MKYTLLMAISLVFAINCNAQTIPVPRESGEMIVQFKSGFVVSPDMQLSQDIEGAGLQTIRQLSKRMNIWLISFDESAMAANVLEEVRKHPTVSLAQFNHKVTEREVIPNDPSFMQLWGLKNTGQMGGTPLADIKATFAWDITTSGNTVLGDSIVVAMVDGGIDLNHEDLHLWKNRLEIPGNSIDDDMNGFVDDYDGWNAYGNNGNVQSSDHGTHVAGTATAIGNNGTGIAGVAFNTYLMPISGSGSNEAIAVVAYDYIFSMRKIYNETNGAEGAFVVVTNSSFGIDQGNPANYPLWGAIYDSLGSVGILNVASTANRNWDIDVVGDIPTGMTNPSIVAVTNSTNLDGLYSMAGYGLHTIDLAAPGTNIYSSRPGNIYGNKTGTSMSSPHVSGSIAMMYAAADSSTILQYRDNPELVSLKFKQYLIASVDTLPAFVGRTVSGGRLNLHKAMFMVQNPPVIAVLPDTVEVILAPENQTVVDLELSSTALGYNPCEISIPDTASWLTVETYMDTLYPGVHGTIKLLFNSSGMNDGIYTTEVKVKDFFLNEAVIPVTLEVEFGVNTRILSGLEPTLRAFPIPFRGNFEIAYTLPANAQVSFELYNASGVKVYASGTRTIVAGSHTFSINEDLSAGIYLLKMSANGVVKTLKVLAK
ncbi:MAG: S8 family peptidase [Lentimicrobium sp.]|jgi:hypothetical protein|nr:S8 family peptidase [Lentimicrobium sp.]